MTVRPLGSRVLVRPLDAPEKIGSIIVPDVAREKPLEGTVVAIGRGKMLDDGTREAIDLKVGDVVVYRLYAGTELKLDGVAHTMLALDDLLGVQDGT